MRPKITNVFLCLLLALFSITQVEAQISANFLGRFSTGFFDEAAAEISAYDPASKRLFVTNGADTSLRIVDLSNPANPVQITSISIKPYGIDLTSVAAKNGIIAVAVIDSLGKLEDGKVVFFNTSGAYLNQVNVGPNPDMVIFTPNGMKVLVANEGEPEDYKLIDPAGSISIIDLGAGIAGLTQSHVMRAGFESFNSTTLDYRIKITGKVLDASGAFVRNSTIAEDLEPEYIAISEDGNTAWVTCQENNCMAEVNINTATVTRLIPLGFKNHNLSENKLDASNNGTVNMANWPVFGMYQPDAIAAYKVGSTQYIVSANEGDVRADWGSENSEEVRFSSSSYQVDTTKFGGAAAVTALKNNNALGRLTVTNKYGDFNKDGLFDSIFCFGGRSFSIWNGTTGDLVWDSKDQFETITLATYPSNFNCSNTNNTLKNRSDDKGPEPEAMTIGVLGDSTYAFIGLERIGGVMIYNITNPNSPYFVQYINTRNFTQTPGVNLGGDLGPEGILFVPAGQSPNGKPMLIVSNEISGTVTIFNINAPNTFKLQILHSSDMESGIDAPIDAPNFAAVLDTLEDTYPNTLRLASGDCYIPGPFLASGEDPSLVTPLRSTASSYYAGTTSGLRAAIGRIDIAMMNIMGFQGSALGNHEFDLGTPEVNSIIGVDIRNNGADKRWIGAQFPYLSANLDFSADANLNYLVTNNQLNWHEFKTSPSITANSQKKGIAPSAIIEVNGEKIGIVGATTQVLASISSPGSTTVIGASTNDMPQLAAILQPVIDTLRIKHGINKIIVMSHLQQLANEKALAPLLKGVDIIIAGGSHALCTDGTDRIRPGTTSLDHYPIMTQNLDNEPLAILNTSAEWKYLGRFVVSFDSLGVMLPSSLDSTINGAYAADSQMVQSLYGTYADGFKVNSKGALVRTLTSAVANVINNKDGNLFGKTNVYLEGTRNQVRKEESNLGNLSSDANLWYAKLVDPSVKISLKNGGGIRSSIGAVVTVGSVTNTEPPLANPGAGKPKGAISQLDIENSLRFNNKLSILTMNAAGVKRIVEHGLAATNATATPGQFPQVGGIAFSYDYSKPAGNRVWSLVTLDSLGNKMDTIVREGMLYGDTTRQFKMVTLDFLAGGGDGYPFAANSSNRVNLDTAMTQSMFATFAGNGSEQDAFAEFMYAKHSTNAFNVRDTNLYGDKRIQQLNTRPDAIFPETNPAITIAAAKLVSPPNNVRIRGVISRAWGRFIYIQDATSGIAVRQSSGQMVNEILSGSLKEGDSVEVLGPRNDFNNYAQIQLASGNYSSMNTVIKIASTTKVQPKMVTISQMLANAEEYENVLVRIKGIRTSATGNFSASTNYTIWDGPQVGDTTLLRVISALDTEMEDAPALAIPQDTFTFEGILAQFCSSPSNGCTTGYQLYGVRKADIVYNYPVSISEARSIAAPTLVKTRGVISRAWGRFIYIQDASGAIAVRQSAGDMVTAITTGDLKEGDSVEVFGPRNDFNNYAQFQLASGSYTATNYVVKLGVGSKVIAKNITVKDLLADAENHESELVRIKGLRITGTGNFAASTNYTIWDGTQVGDSILLRVISGADTELEDAPETAIPQDTFTFEGILAQFCSSPSNGCSTGYQLYGVRKADIIYTPTPKPTINSFNLVSPANNAVVVVESGSTSPLSIVWTNAKATTYKWMAILPTGNFTAPLLVLPSNNSGMDTTLTLVSGSVDAILAGMGILPGQSANLKWTVFAYLGTDSLKANQDYNITLTRKLVLGTFSLLTPANNARVEVEAGGTQNVDITWSASANATRYAWYLATTAGSFATPIVSLNSDNSGTDTKLTLVSGTVDALLATNGVAQGDSIVLKWTVYSFAGTDSIKAQQDNQINLVRKKAVGLSTISLNQLVTFYPNPVQSKLYITSDLNLTGAKILVYDLQGRVVINENYSTEGISMEGLSKGMYQVVLKNGDAQATAKVIVE